MNSHADKPAPNEWGSYWNDASSSGEVFVGKNGQAHPDIAKWWQAVFLNLPENASVVDLACGAGSVFNHLPKNHTAVLFAADISTQALTQLKQRFPTVNTSACSADKLPYEDNQFGYVVSQFGIEYAGEDAFTEALRVLEPGGSLKMLCHVKDGYIDARNQAHLAQARVIESSQFISCARELMAAMAQPDQAAIDRAVKKFQPAEKQLSAACQALPEGIHLHLYQGFRQLYENRRKYAQQDILAWLDDMSADVDRNIYRLQHMCSAARSEDALDIIVARMRTAGCAEISYEPLKISGHELPIAWAVSGKK